MNLENKSSESWEKIETDKTLVAKALQHAEKDLETAKNVFKTGDYDWCYSIAYNSMLSAGRALMFNDSVRPKGEGKHVSVIDYLRYKYSKEFEEDLFLLNKMRKKRHLVVYEEVNIVSEEESEFGIATAEKFIRKVKGIIN